VEVEFVIAWLLAGIGSIWSSL